MNQDDYHVPGSYARSLCCLLLWLTAALAGGHAAAAAAPAAAAGAPASGANVVSAHPRGAPAVSVDNLLAAASAGDQASLARVAAQLKSKPRVPRGDRRLARSLNERGLALWRRQRFEEAAVFFRQAHEADASDVEIRENLGYALLKSGKVVEARSAILSALEMAPERASAWGSLGLIQAKQGGHREAVAFVLTAYRYAPDPVRALDVYQRLAETDEDPRVRAMLGDVVSRLKTAPQARPSGSR